MHTAPSRVQQKYNDEVAVNHTKVTIKNEGFLRLNLAADTDLSNEEPRWPQLLLNDTFQRFVVPSALSNYIIVTNISNIP